jgi:hypothetical protein
MRGRLWTKLARVAGVIAICALSASAISVADAKSSAGKPAPSITGAWMAKITFVSNPPPTATNGAETSLEGFGADGLLSEWATAGRTTGYGVWKPTNQHGGFTYTFRELALSADDALLGYVVVTQTGSVSADGKTYSAAGHGQLYSLAGKRLGPPSATKTRAARIRL